MLKRSGSKSVTIDGRRLRYRVCEDGAARSGCLPLAVIVQAETNGTKLRVRGLLAQRVPEIESKFYSGRTVRTPIMPSDVAGLVSTALSSGWRPDGAGGVFEMTVATGSGLS